MVPPLVGARELISAVLSSVYAYLVGTVDSTSIMVSTTSHSKSVDPKSVENKQQQGRVNPDTQIEKKYNSNKTAIIMTASETNL